ncbi:MAG: c-type cytochrome, partial [Planctomycetales bacterium]|nr:c-type cytochrome [Planctomycetales bacterium]
NTHRETGRIYKISYGNPAHEPVNLARLDANVLVDLHQHANEWYVRHARRLLQERAARGDDLNESRQRLREVAADVTQPVPLRLRHLWTWYSLGDVEPQLLVDLMSDENLHVRRWAIRLLANDRNPRADVLAKWNSLAQSDAAPQVRLELASALQRMPLTDRWEIAQSLAGHVEDAHDANLPLMVWYAIEPLVNLDLDHFCRLAIAAKIPRIRQHIARRAAELVDGRDEFVGFNRIAEQLARTDRDDVRHDLLQGILSGFLGRRQVAAPPGWPELYATLAQSNDTQVREAALSLALLLKDPRATAELRRRIADRDTHADLRNRAIEALVATGARDLADLLQSQLSDPLTQAAAIRGLAQVGSDNTPSLLLSHYHTFSAEVKQAAIQTMTSRLDWARVLLDAVQQDRVVKSDLTAFTIRQLSSFHDEQLTARVEKLWGGVRETPADRRRLIELYKRRLSPANLEIADAAAGRTVFQKTCANCHRLFGEGGSIGPDITGSQRQSLDYLLENLIDPNAIVPNDYRMVVLETADGRVLTGLVVDETDAAVTLQTATEKVVVPSDEIEERSLSPLSMMPEGQLQTLTEVEIRDLIKYLMSR